MRKNILGNLRRLTSAADQYFIEHRATEVEGAKLIRPAGFLAEIPSIDGEDYKTLRIQKEGVIKFTTRSGIQVEYYLPTDTSTPPK